LAASQEELSSMSEYANLQEYKDPKRKNFEGPIYYSCGLSNAESPSKKERNKQTILPF
jgi:hypothetical protein